MKTQSQPIDRPNQDVSEVARAIVRSMAVSVEVFLHGPMGTRHIDCGVAAILVLFVFRNCFPPSEGSPLSWFTIVYAVVWFCRMSKSMYLRHRGRMRTHSMYCGSPYLWRLLPGWREEYVKHLEAAAVIGLGFGIRMLNRPMGDYLIGAGAVMLFRSAALAFGLHHRVVEMQDSALEQRYVAEQFRQLRSDDVD